MTSRMAIAHIPSTTSDTSPSLSIRIGAAPADVEGLLLHMWCRPDPSYKLRVRRDSRDLGEAPQRRAGKAVRGLGLGPGGGRADLDVHQYVVQPQRHVMMDGEPGAAVD